MFLSKTVLLRDLNLNPAELHVKTRGAAYTAGNADAEYEILPVECSALGICVAYLGCMSSGVDGKSASFHRSQASPSFDLYVLSYGQNMWGKNWQSALLAC